MEISAKVKETMQTAQKQFVELENDVQKFVGRVHERVLAGPADGVKKVDDLLRAMVVTDFVEKIRDIEMVKHGTGLKQDLLDRFGLVNAKDVQTMQDRLDKLQKEVTTLKARATKLAKRPTGTSAAAFNTLKSRVVALEKAAKGQ
jgi:polyhydroxyalkanoate synthesis regulator phasin